MNYFSHELLYFECSPPWHYFVIVSDISSGSLNMAYYGIYMHIFSDFIFWHSIWHSILTFYTGSISDIFFDIPTALSKNLGSPYSSALGRRGDEILVVWVNLVDSINITNTHGWSYLHIEGWKAMQHMSHRMHTSHNREHQKPSTISMNNSLKVPKLMLAYPFKLWMALAILCGRWPFPTAAARAN